MQQVICQWEVCHGMMSFCICLPHNLALSLSYCHILCHDCHCQQRRHFEKEVRVLKCTLVCIIHEVCFDCTKVRHHAALCSDICLACLKSRVPDSTYEQLALHLFCETSEILQFVDRIMVIGMLGSKLVEHEVLALSIIG